MASETLHLPPKPKHETIAFVLTSLLYLALLCFTLLIRSHSNHPLSAHLRFYELNAVLLNPLLIGLFFYVLMAIGLFCKRNTQLFTGAFVIYNLLLSVALFLTGMLHFIVFVAGNPEVMFVVIPFVLWICTCCFVCTVGYFHRFYLWLKLEEQNATIEFYERCRMHQAELGLIRRAQRKDSGISIGTEVQSHEDVDSERPLIQPSDKASNA